MLANQWFCLIPTYTNTAFLSAGKFPTTSFLLGLLSLIVGMGVLSVGGLAIFMKKDIK